MCKHFIEYCTRFSDVHKNAGIVLCEFHKDIYTQKHAYEYVMWIDALEYMVYYTETTYKSQTHHKDRYYHVGI